MAESSEAEVLENLRDFLSTESRKSLFFHYVFKKTSPSDLAESTNTPLSTVDMVTNSLRLMELLKEEKGKDKHKNYYEVDTDLWVTENLKAMGLVFIKEDQKKRMLEIMGDKRFLALSYILTDPDFAMVLYKEPLKMGDDLIVFKLMSLFKRASLVSDLPSYVLMSVLIFPSFKQLKENMLTEKGTAETIKLIKLVTSRYPFLAEALKDVDASALKEYDKKRAALAVLMERLIEQELQSLSTEKVKMALEAEKEAKTKKKAKVEKKTKLKEEEAKEKVELKKEEKGEVKGKEKEPPKKEKKPEDEKKPEKQEEPDKEKTPEKPERPETPETSENPEDSEKKEEEKKE